MLYIQVQLQHLQLIQLHDFSVTIEKFITLQENEGPPEDSDEDSDKDQNERRPILEVVEGLNGPTSFGVQEHRC